ncbi:hypothetical protein B1748_05210 [Paenibacillus sp. MY03]|nr:hypothetical protein B1748_05210 [Paenibacillus sp. MY03]
MLPAGRTVIGQCQLDFLVIANVNEGLFLIVDQGTKGRKIIFDRVKRLLQQLQNAMLLLLLI